MRDNGRGTLRALAVLRALNVENDTTVLRLSAMTGISRQALYRILETLASEGYVARHAESGRYRLTSLVRALSEGFKDEQWIGEIAAPELEKLQRKVVWPTEMAICQNFTMQLILSTRRHSPFVIDYGNVGAVLPILRTALGIAYLAHCPRPERDLILRFYREQGPSLDGDLARNRTRIARILSATRTRGFATRHRNVFSGIAYPDIFDTNATIAVPVTVGSEAVASIGVTYIAAAMTTADAVERYLRALKATARTISRLATEKRRK